MVLLIFSVLLFLFAFPFGEASRISPMLTVSFTLLDLLVVPASLYWLIRQVMQWKKPETMQAKTFAAVIGIFLVSLLVNAGNLTQQQLLTAGLYIVRFFSYGTLFFLYRDQARKEQVKVIMLIGGMLLLVGGFVQYFFYPALRNLLYFGWDEHFYRMFGSFFDPNFFGLFLSLFFLFALSFLKKKQKKRNIFMSILLAIIFAAILLTYSRTALIALVVGVIMYGWRKQYKKWIGIGLVIAASIVVGFFAISSTKTDMNSLLRRTSANARLGSAQNALVIFSDNPLIGVGFNTYRYAQYRHHFMPGSPIQEDHGASGADSSLLLVLATSGIIGFAAFCYFLWSHGRVLLKTNNRLGLATLSAFLIGSFFVNGLFYPLLLVWVWPLLGIIENTSQ